jgi:hypothetical protein
MLTDEQLASCRQRGLRIFFHVHNTTDNVLLVIVDFLKRNLNLMVNAPAGVDSHD